MSSLKISQKTLIQLNEVVKTLEKGAPLTQIQCKEVLNLLYYFPLNEQKEYTEIEILSGYQKDINKFDFQVEKWIQLLNSSIPYPLGTNAFQKATPVEVFETEIIIRGSFYPSYGFFMSKKTINLSLRCDGTALFKFNTIEDAERFPFLFNFNQGWLEAFFLMQKALTCGWSLQELPDNVSFCTP